jgi:hypothetical protein
MAQPRDRAKKMDGKCTGRRRRMCVGQDGLYTSAWLPESEIVKGGTATGGRRGRHDRICRVSYTRCTLSLSPQIPVGRQPAWSGSACRSTYIRRRRRMASTTNRTHSDDRPEVHSPAADLPSIVRRLHQLEIRGGSELFITVWKLSTVYSPSPAQPLHRRVFPFRRYSVDEDGRLVFRTRDANHDPCVLTFLSSHFNRLTLTSAARSRTTAHTDPPTVWHRREETVHPSPETLRW